jgi:meso-butanediol dehydrogenase/(S,S)-butanediol dehydrogenase/diacetyl reductase
MTGRLEGKVALITGTGRGQGRAAALLFAREGATVVGCDLNEKGAIETVELVKAAGKEMLSMQPVYLGDGPQVKKWIDFAIKKTGRIDILYNNASAPKFAPVGQMTWEEWQFTVRNELDIIYWACHYAWPYLKENNTGVIINTASIAGVIATDVELSPNFAHSATKGGVIAVTRQLAMEGARYGIRANVISPGVIVSPATEPGFETIPGLKETLLNMVPLHRLGTVEDIVKVALFLASDDSSYITGTNIVVDGGFTIH